MGEIQSGHLLIYGLLEDYSQSPKDRGRIFNTQLGRLRSALRRDASAVYRELRQNQITTLLLPFSNQSSQFPVRLALFTQHADVTKILNDPAIFGVGIYGARMNTV